MRNPNKMRVLKTLALSLVFAAISGNAAEIQVFFAMQMPTDVEIKKNEKEIELENEYHSGLVLGGGVEYLMSAEFGPFQYGGGLGFMSSQQDTDDGELAPCALPLWGALSLIGKKDTWLAYPYVGTRIGWLLPLTTDGNWWEKPLNYMISANLGVKFPFHAGLEINYTYVSMEKSYDSRDLTFRTYSGRFGVAITGQFDISWDRFLGGEKDLDDLEDEE